MRINNNITALNSHRNYGINNGKLSKNMEKLSSGFRVNRAADDAAGLAISEKMCSQIRGLNMASKNSQDAVSLVQTAEGGMQTIQDILQRMRELAVQARSDTNHVSVDRDALQLEIAQLIEEIDEIADSTEFNKMKLLNADEAGYRQENFMINGSLANVGHWIIQAGANEGQTMTVTIRDLTAVGLDVHDVRVDGGTSQIAGDNANDALVRIDSAINSVSMQRATLGAYQNRLEFKIQNLDNQAENVSAAESRIRDADMAKMMTEFTKNSILFQASTAMLAQANTLPQSVLQLLG